MRRLIATGAGLIATGALLRWQLARWFVEKPKYEVEDQRGKLELRQYPPLVVAQTTVEASTRDGAVEAGFFRLAGYIFGANRTARENPLLSPVSGRFVSEEIPMTAPVTAEPGRPGTWTVSFVMPRQRTLDTLPHPDDSRVKLRQLPPRRLAVLRYSGPRSQTVAADYEKRLLQLVRASGLTIRSQPGFFGYDPASTAPFLRRNEVWVEIAPVAQHAQENVRTNGQNGHAAET